MINISNKNKIYKSKLGSIYTRFTGWFVCFNNKRKFAFTLAEVLITLGIIGVVAALTMPAVVGHYKKQETISRLKKAYTILNQALKLSENDNGEYEYWDDGFNMGAEAYLNKYWLPYFNVLKICNTYSECGYESNMPWTSIDDSSNNHTGLTDNYKRIPFLTSDGILYIISVAVSNDDTGGYSKDYQIFCDLNGPKAPNTEGKDFFRFTRVTGKGILPLGYNKTSTEIDKSCSKTGNGQYCAAKIIKDGWQILSDYPY